MLAPESNRALPHGEDTGVVEGRRELKVPHFGQMYSGRRQQKRPNQRCGSIERCAFRSRKELATLIKRRDGGARAT